MGRPADDQRRGRTGEGPQLDRTRVHGAACSAAHAFTTALVRFDAGPPGPIPAAVGAEIASHRAAAADLNRAIGSKSPEVAIANAQPATREAELSTARAEIAARHTVADVGARIEKPPWWRRVLGQVTVVGSAAACAAIGVAIGGPSGAVAGAAIGAVVGSIGRQ